MSIASTGSSHDTGVGEKRREPLTVTVSTAAKITGFGRTKLHELMGTGRLKSTKVDGKRLVNYASLKQLVGAE